MPGERAMHGQVRKMYNCATMKYLRITAPAERRVASVRLSRHPPIFDGLGKDRLLFEPNEHFLIYALRGRRDIAGGGFEYAVVPETLRVHAKGARYVLDTRQTYEEIAIAFTARPGDRIVEELAPLGGAVHLPLLCATGGNPLPRGWCRQILAGAAASSASHGLQRDAWLHLLFAELVARGEGIASDGESPIARVVEAIEARIDRAPDMDALGARVGMSRRTLIRRFKAETGKSVGQFLLARRIALAQKMLLSDPSLPARGLAAQLGFFDEYHFGHAFKKIAGISPKRFARRP